MEKAEIPVVWGIDKKYVLQSFVVMRSILIHSKCRYDFFLLTADDIENEARGYEDVLKNEFEAFSVYIRKVKEDRLKDVKIFNEHLSIAAYYRLLIPELIPEYDKCIYLDCDLMVQGDLKELFQIYLGKCYIAGVRDCHIMDEKMRPSRHREILGLPDLDSYINSGVMVMNLKRMREDHCSTDFFKQMEKENLYEDQDILNVCCYPWIKILPLKYNLFHFYLGKNIKFLFELPYERYEFNFDHDHPYILHMGASYKPWLFFSVKGSKEWWRLAKVFCTSTSYQYYWQMCFNEERKNEIERLIERAKEAKFIVIWGAGKNGRQLCNILLEHGLEHLRGIADNNKDLWGNTYRGISILKPQKLMEHPEDILWIISCRINYSEIWMQLRRNGIEENDILHYNNRYDDMFYLLSLQENAYEHELDQLANLEYVKKIPNLESRKRYIRDIVKNPACYTEQYSYLARKYNFRYWIGV